MNNHKFDIVIYHQNCPDGICGLWCAHMYKKDSFEKIGIPAGKDPIGNFENKRLLFIDVCPSYNFLINTSKIANKITVLDHHKSAYDMYLTNKNELEKLSNVKLHFNMNLSGCQIAWDYLFNNSKREWFIDYVGDQDLWKFELVNSKEINCSLEFNKFIDSENLNKLDELQKYTDEDILNLALGGGLILRIKNNIMNKQLEYSEERKMIVGDKVYHVQVGTISSSDMKSTFGNMLATKKFNDGSEPDFGVVWSYWPEKDEWYISLRGAQNSPDLSAIATFFGGGGHPKASAFVVKENPFHSLIIL
jgi:oligoribonuclease NrnB/cAMP/cGMP phosphodiesterase (DHH superfamily)